MMLLREWREWDDVRDDHLDERLITGVIVDLEQLVDERIGVSEARLLRSPRARAHQAGAT